MKKINIFLLNSIVEGLAAINFLVFPEFTLSSVAPKILRMWGIAILLYAAVTWVFYEGRINPLHYHISMISVFYHGSLVALTGYYHLWKGEFAGFYNLESPLVEFAVLNFLHIPLLVGWLVYSRSFHQYEQMKRESYY